MNSLHHNLFTQSLCAWLCLSLVILPLQAAPITNVSSVNVSEDKGALLVAIEMDSAASVQQFTLPNPPRIVIDIRNARQTIAPTNEQIFIPINKGGLERARIGQMGSIVRIVFDTTSQVRSEVTWSGTRLLVRFHASTSLVNQPLIKTSPQAASRTKQVSAKKHFQEGIKQEALQRWEVAAQEFALAAAAEPDNTEYRLHLLRALQKASLMFASRGDALVAQQDFTSAYTAYSQAFSLDPTNELARAKMERMSEQQRQPASPGKYEIVTANATTSSADIKAPRSSRSGDLLQTVNFQATDLRQVIEFMAEKLELNVLFDESFKNETNFRFKLNNVTMARALDLVLAQTRHAFEQVERRTILIYGDNATNRQRVEQMLVKTFYLGNADLEQARTLLQAIAGGQHLVIPIKQLNALVVRDTASNLRMMQELLDSIDKNRAEVVIDVDIYEVSRNTSLEIGNQLALGAQPVTETRFDTQGNPVTVTRGQSSSLGNLGGIGRAGIAAIAGTTVSPVLGGVGTLLGLPPSSLSLLQSKGQSKLLASSQIHALDGEQNQTKVGRSVPVRLGTSVIPSYPALPAQGAAGQVVGAVQSLLGGGYNGFSSGGFDSIQYRDVGLVIDVTPAISKEGHVQIKMKLESTSVEASGADINLTPSFTQRSLTTVARVMDGKTAVVAGIKQEAKGDSRAGLPVIGLLPVLGRFFSTPRQTSNLSDIIITVTPHILRAPKLNQEDHLARSGGSQKGGVLPTIEEVVLHAQTEDDEDRQRRGPEQRSLPTAPPIVTARIAEVKAPLTEPAVLTPATQTVPATQAVKSEATEVAPEPEAIAAPPDEVGKVNKVSLKVVPITTRPRIGETFAVAVAVNGAASMTGATVALNFDPARMQFKAVRDGGLLGNRALLRQQVHEGRLHLTLQPPAENTAPAFAQGQLFLLEFVALAEGEARIEFDLNETSLQLTGEASVELAARNAQVTIRRNDGGQ